MVGSLLKRRCPHLPKLKLVFGLLVHTPTYDIRGIFSAPLHHESQPSIIDTHAGSHFSIPRFLSSISARWPLQLSLSLSRGHCFHTSSPHLPLSVALPGLSGYSFLSPTHRVQSKAGPRTSSVQDIAIILSQGPRTNKLPSRSFLPYPDGHTKLREAIPLQGIT